MFHKQALFPGLLLALLVGCTSATAPKVGWLERWRPFQGPTGPDVVHLYVATIERPIGDAYLSEEVWAGADEQVVALERRSALDENGLRVGSVGGILPPQLQALFTASQSESGPRLRQFRAGNVKSLDIGRPLARCHFQLQQEGQTLPVELADATCSLHVLPTLTRDGRTRLQFTPVIQHGRSKLVAQPAADRSRWEFLEQRSTETYSAVAFEVTLTPSEFILIGARAQRPGTLGQRYFVREDEPVPVERLLVLRVNRATAPNSMAQEEEDKPAARIPSLAAQAVWSALP